MMYYDSEGNNLALHLEAENGQSLFLTQPRCWVRTLWGTDLARFAQYIDAGDGTWDVYYYELTSFDAIKTFIFDLIDSGETDGWTEAIQSFLNAHNVDVRYAYTIDDDVLNDE